MTTKDDDLGGSTPPAEATKPGEPKPPKGPRRESTKVAAAEKIARTYHDPKTLLSDMKAPDHVLAALAAETEAVTQAEKSLASRRVALKERKQFAEEIAGLPDLSLIGIKAVLAERAK
jgi:hypothetical protein